MMGPVCRFKGPRTFAVLQGLPTWTKVGMEKASDGDHAIIKTRVTAWGEGGRAFGQGISVITVCGDPLLAKCGSRPGSAAAYHVTAAGHACQHLVERMRLSRAGVHVCDKSCTLASSAWQVRDRNRQSASGSAPM